MNFGDILKDLIYEHNITQKQLSIDLNIAPSTLGNYIRNFREPSIGTLKTLAKYFNVSVDYLLDFHSSETSKNTRGDKEILKVYHSLSDKYKIILVQQGKVLIKYSHGNNSSS